MLYSLLTLVLLALSGVPATAEDACDRSEYRQFDFWLGDWQVRRPDGQPAGAAPLTGQIVTDAGDGRLMYLEAVGQAPTHSR